MSKHRSSAAEVEDVANKATLIRLANSCARLAARGNTVTPIAHELDAADYQTIAGVLRGMAAMIPEG